MRKQDGKLMTAEHDLLKIESLYDTVAKEYANSFFREHDSKPKDQEILLRFSKEIGGRKPVWDFGCGPGQTTRHLADLGVQISGLDLSERLLHCARSISPGISFSRGNVLELDFKDNSIAGAVAFYPIVHFSKMQVARTFSEAFRL